MLEGSIAEIGTQYLLTLKAVNCATGETLASTEARANDKNHVLDALGATASAIRNSLGESLSTIQRFDAPLDQATTSSLDALKAFSAARRIASTTGSAAAIPSLLHAIDIDPRFALAYAFLGRLYADIGEARLAAEPTRRAYELRDRTSELEKCFISASFHMVVTGNMEKAEQTCGLCTQAYPRSGIAHDFLSGIVYPVLGHYGQAVDEARQAIRVNPDDPIAYVILMADFTVLDRLAEAQQADDQALARGLDHPFLHGSLYQLAFLAQRRSRHGAAGRVGRRQARRGRHAARARG